MKLATSTMYFEDDGFPVLLTIGRSWIYAVECVAPDGDNPIKIGITNGSPLQRLESMQTGCPYQLKLLGVLPKKLEEDEARLHIWLADDQVQGEWFWRRARMEILIKRLATYEKGDKRARLFIRCVREIEPPRFLVEAATGPVIYYAPDEQAARRFVTCAEGLSIEETRALAAEWS